MTDVSLFIGALIGIGIPTAIVMRAVLYLGSYLDAKAQLATAQRRALEPKGWR